MHHAMAHETVLLGCEAHSATYGVATTFQNAEEWESTLFGLHAEANKAWKETNDVIFSHLLRYDSQLVAFILSAKATLWDKCEEIWRCVHSLVETANLSP